MNYQNLGRTAAKVSPLCLGRMLAPFYEADFGPHTFR